MSSTLTADHLFGHDGQLAGVAPLKEVYSRVADEAAIERTKEALQKNTHHVHIFNTGAEALQAIKGLIPKGASVHNSASISLAQIGYLEYAKTTTDFNNLHTAILAESDPAKQNELRRQAALADFVISSASVLTETGDIVLADLTGTRVGPAAMGKNVIFVVGANKITPTFDEAMKRLYEYVLPLESARVREAYHMPQGQSNVSNLYVIRGGNPWGAPRVHVIIVKESLGY